MGLFRLSGFEELTTPKAGTMRAKWRKKRMRRLKRKRRKMRQGPSKRLAPGLQPWTPSGGLGTQPPHGVLKKSMGRLLSSKTSSNILPEVGSPEDRGFQEPYSVLQRDLII